MKRRWTPLAGRHLESAYEFLAQDTPTAADKAIEPILSAVELLEQRPEMGRKGRVHGTKELVITGTPFVVAYRLRREYVEILALLHGARRWPNRL